MDIRIIEQAAQQEDYALREFRLTGNLEYLLALVNCANKIAENVDEKQLTNDFLNALTDNEKIAFKAIQEQISYSNGYISIVKMVEKTGLSRPVFANLLAKMEKFGIAQPKSAGVKGTFIEWRIRL